MHSLTLTRFLMFLLVSSIIASTCYGHGPKRYITPKDIVKRGSLTCIASPSETEGPYYVSGMPYRVDITESKSGFPIHLYITILDLATCLPTKQNVTVEIWHCDHLGIYSHYEEASKNYANPKTDTNTYFRGKQFTNSSAVAYFKTIYPGWYTGRDNHIHVRIWQDSTLLLTSQFSFNDSMTDAVAKVSPYTSNTNQRTSLSTDSVFKDNGVLGMLTLKQISSSDISAGFYAYVEMGVSMNGTTASEGNSLSGNVNVIVMVIMALLASFLFW